MIYFDNAATTFPKPKSVINAAFDCINGYCANPGRSSHEYAIKCQDKIYEARELIAEYISLPDPERIVFTQNATASLNIAIKTMIPTGSHVIISNLEHNSVLRPIAKLSSIGKISYSTFDALGNIEKNIKDQIRENTRAIVSTLSSNVSGREIPLSVLSRIADEHKLILIADASQIAGHKKIDISKYPTDALCAPGHKGLFSLQGVGFIAFGGKKVPNDSFIEGGSGFMSKSITMPNKLPELLEGGTLPTPSIISLSSGIRFINDVTQDAIIEHIEKLRLRLTECISEIKKIKIVASEGAILSITSNKGDNTKLERLLSENGIATRGGLHCAPMAHTAYGTDRFGTVRISLSYFNKLSHAETLYKTLKNGDF